MTWTKLDDRFHANKKIALLDSDMMLPALGLYTLALSWSASELTDGFIPRNQVCRLGGDKSTLELADELVRVSLWESCDGGYQIHDYLDYNPSKAEADNHRKHISDVRSDAGKRGAESRWGSQNDDGKTSGNAGEDSKPLASDVTSEVTTGSQTDGPDPDPVPLEERSKPKARAKSGRADSENGETLDRLANLAIREVRDSESQWEDYRAVCSDHLGRLPADIIESIIYQLAEWEPNRTYRKWHTVLGRWLTKEDPPSASTDDGYKLYTDADIPEHLREYYQKRHDGRL